MLIKYNYIDTGKKRVVIFNYKFFNYSSLNAEEMNIAFFKVKELLESFEKAKIIYIDTHFDSSEIDSINITNENTDAQIHYAESRVKTFNFIKNKITLKKAYFILEISDQQNELDFINNILKLSDNFIHVNGEQLKILCSKIYQKTFFNSKGESNYSEVDFKNVKKTRMRIETEGYFYTSLNLFSFPTKVSQFFLSKLLAEKNTLVSIEYELNDEVYVEEVISKSKEAIEEKEMDNKKTSRYRARKEKKDIEFAYQQVIDEEKRSGYFTISLHYKSNDLDDVESWEDEMIRKYSARMFKLVPTFGKKNVLNNYINILGYNNQLLNAPNYKKFFLTEVFSISGLFNGGSIMDNDSFFYGLCENGYPLLLDMFVEKGDRKSFDSLIFGKKGFGKTSLIKSIIINYCLKGIKMKIYDIENDYIYLVKKLGGKVIDFTGKEFGMNIFQLENAVTNELKYEKSVSKIIYIMANILNLSEDDEVKIEILIMNYYKKCEVYNSSTFTEYINSCNESIAKDKCMMFVDRINISEVLKKIFFSEENIEYDNSLICYDLSSINELDDKYFNSLVITLLNNDFSRAMHDKVTKEVIVLDEMHRIVNTSNIKAAKIVGNILKQARKYLIQFIGATQSPSHIIHEDADKEAVKVINDIFNLTTYFFNFMFEKNQANLLARNTEIVESYREKIPYLNEFEFILKAEKQTLKAKLFIADSDWKYWSDPKNNRYTPRDNEVKS